MDDRYDVQVSSKGLSIPCNPYNQTIGVSDFAVTQAEAGVPYLILWSFDRMKARLDEEYESLTTEDQVAEFEIIEQRVYHSTFPAKGGRVPTALLSPLEVAVGDAVALLDRGDLVIALRAGDVDQFYETEIEDVASPQA